MRVVSPFRERAGEGNIRTKAGSFLTLPFPEGENVHCASCLSSWHDEPIILDEDVHHREAVAPRARQAVHLVQLKQFSGSNLLLSVAGAVAATIEAGRASSFHGVLPSLQPHRRKVWRINNTSLEAQPVPAFSSQNCGGKRARHSQHDRAL